MKSFMIIRAKRVAIALLSFCAVILTVSASRANPDQLIISISPKKPLIIYAHGGAGYRGADKARVAMVKRMGFSTIAFDAFEMNGIKDWRTANAQLSLDQKQDYIAGAVRAAIAFARSRADVDQNNIFFYGQSNGGAVALYFANRESNIRGVIAEAPSGDGRYAYRGDIRVPSIVFFGRQDNWGGRREDDLIYTRRVSFASTPTVTWLNSQKSAGRPVDLIFYDRAGHSFHSGNLRKTGRRGIEWYIGSSPSVVQSYENDVRRFLRENVRR